MPKPKTQNHPPALDTASLRSWIEANLRSIRSEQDIATGVGLHIETLRKKVARDGNRGLWKWVQHCRVEKMKHLLDSTDMKCLAICLEVGISREDAGARFFKHMVGMTMKQYRERTGSNNG
jgi:AraC-like DNA-binding protein